MALLISPTTRITSNLDASTLSDIIDLLPEDEAGHCTWNIGYSWDGTTRDGRPRELTLDVSIQIELPVWTGREAATPAERAEWDRFLGELRSHETEHETIVRREVEVMYERMLRTRTSRLNGKYVREKERIQSVSDSFDARTDHGRRPPPGTNITVPE